MIKGSITSDVTNQHHMPLGTMPQEGHNITSIVVNPQCKFIHEETADKHKSRNILQK